MKKIIMALLLTVALLCMSIPALANSFGISPSSAELEIPKDGSATQEFTFTGYTGTITIGLEDIPLSIDPIGDIAVTDGETVTVTFYGDGTNNTYEGKITFLAMMGEQVAAGIKVRLTLHVNMTTEVVSPPVTGGGGGGPSLSYLKTNLFGIEKYYYNLPDGTLWTDIAGTSQDGNLTVNIPTGTVALDKDGYRLSVLAITVDEDPPPPPEDSSIIGLPYDFSPAGATFTPPLELTWSYDSLPEGVLEGELTLAYYVDGMWVELDCVVDPETNTITASVSHFTTFAIIGEIISAPLVEPTEPIEPIEPVEPTEPIESVEPTEPIESVEPTGPVEPEEPITEEEPSYGALIGGILGGLILLGMIAGLLYWLRSRKKGE